MCGISAILRAGRFEERDTRDLRSMHDTLRHRGPDAEGAFFADARRGLRFGALEEGLGAPESLNFRAAVRRLRVSDLRAEADQPLLSADGKACVLLNGAIYNHRELGRELAAGGALRTSSDAEVVVEAYRRWGTACFERFRGMWAILIVDLERGVLVGSRDRFGIKPLYYALDEGRLLLGSEPAPLAQALAAGPRPEPARFFEFLSGYPPRSSALTFFRDVHPVPAASWFTAALDADRIAAPTFHAFWDLADYHWDGARPAISFEEAVQAYRELLQAAVEEQTRADAKVGGLLSGGLDTSTLVSMWGDLAAARSSQPPETFSIAWDDARMDESDYQQAVVAKVGGRSHRLKLTPGDIWDHIDRVVEAQGQPLLGQDLIAQYLVYGHARAQDAVVILDGSGSDEVQAGLPPYEAEMVVERLERFELWDVARELSCMARRYQRPLASVAGQYLLAPLRRNLRERRGLPRYDWLDESRCDVADPQWSRADARDESRDPSRVNRLLYRETKHTNVPAVLMYSDRNAMAHSIEARFPYLDHRLVEFCFRLPPSFKVGFGRRKKLLWEAARGIVPSLVHERRDKKMFVRLDNWMPLRRHADALRDAARDAAFSRIEWIDAPRLARFVDGFVEGRHENAYAAWRVLTASRWLAMNRSRGAA